MQRKSLGLAVLLSLYGSIATASDYGFPTLNTLGRYLGVGWSHHTYHSPVDGRFDAITNRHPACMYPSNSLSYMYSPDYRNLPSRTQVPTHTNGFWNAPIVLEQDSSSSMGSSIVEDRSRGNSGLQSGANGRPKLPPKPSNVEELLPPNDDSAGSSSDATAKPKQPERPSEPAPGWLKPYLEKEPGKSSDDSLELDASPSDQKSAFRGASQNRYRR